MKKQFIPVLVLALCAALVGAGCGGDDDETTTATTTSTTGATGATGASGEDGQAAGGGLLPADFAEEADAICKEANDKIDAAFEGTSGRPTDADLDKIVTDEFVPAINDALAQLSDLGEPEEGAEEFQTFQDDTAKVADDLEKDPNLLGESEGGKDPFADVNKQAEALGLPACAG